MSLEYPVQTRAIDPYSSYNSDIVNRLTRLITRGKNCLHGTHAIDAYADSTSSNTIIIIPGQCFKDDVIISIDQPMVVDLTSSDYYINHQNPWNEAGYYWLCLEYTYAKAKPAPQAKIRLLKPSQHHLFAQSGAFLFLKAIEVTFDGTVFNMGSLYDHDPSLPEMKREYAQVIAGVEDSVPTFIQERDEGRLVYVRDQDELYFGTSERWESFNAIRANIDTTLCEVGQLGYLDIDGKVKPALATNSLTHADCGVIQIGPAHNGDGKVRLYGKLEDVPIEPGRTISEGENVYLSSLTPGAVTDLMQGSNAQFIGTCVTPGISDTTCDIWFLPTRSAGVGNGANSWQDVYQDLLLGSVYTNLFTDQFSNYNFVDTTSSTSTLVTYNFTMDGSFGDRFYSTNITESGWSAPMTSCQVSAEVDGNVSWYVNNSIDDEDAWEFTELNKIHNFSEVVIALDSVHNGPFIIGEKTQGSTSLKNGYVNAFSNNRLFLSLVSREPVNYDIGETITGLTSNATGVVVSVTSRVNNNVLRVMAEYEGVASIYDYGVLYGDDEDLLYCPNNCEANVDTLFFDVYANPIEFNDGNPKLAIPLETQIINLNNSLSSQISTLNNNLQTVYEDVYSSPSYDDDGLANLSLPLESQLATTNVRIDTLETNIAATNADFDDDIQKLYNDLYTTPQRDHDPNPDLSVPVQTQLEIIHLEQYSTHYFADGDTTPTVLSTSGHNHHGKLWIINEPTTPYIITNFDDALPGQEIDVLFNTNTESVAIQDNANIHLQGGNDFIGKKYDLITLIYSGSIWIEKSRSLNS